MYVTPGAPPPVITLAQSSSVITSPSAGAAWSPTTNSLTGVTAGDLLLGGGAWWNSVDGSGGTQTNPTDSNGTWVKAGAACPTVPTIPTPVPGWPVLAAMFEQLNAAAGSHTFTPPDIFTGGGDGTWVVAQFHAASGSAWSRVDDGYGLSRSGTAGGVTGVTVTTAGAAAKIGDLCVVNAAVDGDPTAFGFGAPAGSWNTIFTDGTTTLRATGGMFWRIVTAAGAQSATFSFSDGACEIMGAGMAIYRRS